MQLTHWWCHLDSPNVQQKIPEMENNVNAAQWLRRRQYQGKSSHLDMLEHVRMVADLFQLHNRVHQGFCPSFALDKTTMDIWNQVYYNYAQHISDLIVAFYCLCPLHSSFFSTMINQDFNNIEVPNFSNGAFKCLKGEAVGILGSSFAYRFKLCERDPVLQCSSSPVILWWVFNGTFSHLN